MKTTTTPAILVAIICLIICPVSKAESLATAITYEGVLANDDGPAEGLYDFSFALHGTADPNMQTQIGSAIRMNEYNVVNGHFQAELDFGNGDPNVFNGDARWLETIAWPSGSTATESDFIYLVQEIKAVPYTLLNRGIFVDKERNVGIGTSSPNEKLHVAGRAQFDLGSGKIHMSTPGGWPGIIAFSPNGHRRDVIIDDVSIRLLTSESSSAAPGQNGITIRENGNVGINTASPNHMLEVKDSSENATIKGENSGSGYGVYGYSDNQAGVVGESKNNVGVYGSSDYIGVHGWNISENGIAGVYGWSTNGNGVFGTSVNGYAGYFQGAKNYFEGNVGIGTENPEYKLHVVGHIAYTGNIYDVSDVRLKENIVPLDNALEKVTSIRSVYFNNIGESENNREIGVIAQEVEKVLPEVVSEDAQGYKSVDYSKLTPLLIEAVKEQQTQIEALKVEIKELKERVDTIPKSSDLKNPYKNRHG